MRVDADKKQFSVDGAWGYEFLVLSVKKTGQTLDCNTNAILLKGRGHSRRD